MSRLIRSVPAAAYIGHSVRTLEGWRRNGKGPKFIKPGKIVFYDVRDLDAYMAGGNSETEAEQEKAA